MSAKTHCKRGHEFSKENTMISSGKKRCRTCCRKQCADWKRSNSIKAKNLNWKYTIQAKYGLDIESIRGVPCEICGTTEFTGQGNKPHIDHDHSCCSGEKSCGKCVRGILCNNCNRGLGAFLDNPKLLTNAINYLERKKNVT